MPQDLLKQRIHSELDTQQKWFKQLARDFAASFMQEKQKQKYIFLENINIHETTERRFNLKMHKNNVRILE